MRRIGCSIPQTWYLNPELGWYMMTWKMMDGIGGGGRWILRVPEIFTFFCSPAQKELIVRCIRVYHNALLRVTLLPACPLTVHTHPHPPYFIYVGLASVGNDTVKHATHCLSWTTRVPFFFFLAAGHSWLSSYRSFVRGEEPFLRTRGMIVSHTR